MIRKQPIITIVFSLICISLIWISSNINWGKEDWRGALEADAKGYYAYLPAIFIYHDLNFGFFDEIEKEKYYEPLIYQDYRSEIDGKVVNKYYCGTAIAQTPFFLIAHFISYLDDEPLDGYSKWYMRSVTIAAIFYHLLGLYFFALLLRSYRVKPIIIAFLLISISLGSNLYVYTIVEPGMSHVYSFAFVTMFLYYARLYFLEKKAKRLYLTIAALALVILCRPINGLIIFSLFFLSENLNEFIKTIRVLVNSRRVLITAFAIGGVILFIQPLIYKVSTGSFWVYSYQEEGFNFLHPHFLDILFSYKKGLFLYTPLFFIAFLSVFYWIKKMPYRFISWMSFFILITYVFSSWWMWFYGGSFSSRVYVEYLSFFALPLALCLNKFNKKKLVVAFTALVLIVIVCQIQSYQYRYYEIHYSEMTKEKYWEVFLGLQHLR